MTILSARSDVAMLRLCCTELPRPTRNRWKCVETRRMIGCHRDSPLVKESSVKPLILYKKTGAAYRTRTCDPRITKACDAGAEKVGFPTILGEFLRS